jgi:hypothetical protein
MKASTPAGMQPEKEKSHFLLQVFGDKKVLAPRELRVFDFWNRLTSSNGHTFEHTVGPTVRLLEPETFLFFFALSTYLHIWIDSS